MTHPTDCLCLCVLACLASVAGTTGLAWLVVERR